MRTQDPGFWEDAKRAEAQMKKVKELKKWIELYHEVKAAAEELELAYEYVKEQIVSEEEGYGAEIDYDAAEWNS